ncbi:hypothetical protein NDU88_003941 [Pleurodeles waltl]|uniref:Uncharacterized protein n=1 Tax=Pleurodeles waltl TaxID=8319 RepID=A0AAV7LK88_PLEWA|nr:hypothetical protein NDU88_003941 [Pleurodeles waltl]
MDAPLEHMIKTLSEKSKIQKYCKQWHRDTKAYAQPWLKEGTFDEDIVEHALAYIRSKYQQKRKKREAILPLWRVFCDTKTKVKVTEPKEAATQEQEKPPEQAPEEPSQYGIYPTLLAVGYRDPEGVEPKGDGTDVKGAGERPVPHQQFIGWIMSRKEETGQHLSRGTLENR